MNHISYDELIRFFADMAERSSEAGAGAAGMMIDFLEAAMTQQAAFRGVAYSQIVADMAAILA